MTLLETFEDLVHMWRDVFPQRRSFDRARRLIFGLTVCLRAHLTTNAICAVGRQFLDWSGDYRLLSRSPWNPHQLFDPVFDRVRPLLKPDLAPVLMPLDDTLCKKSGRKIPGVTTLRDPQSPPFHVNLIPGLRFVQASLLVTPQSAGPARALPVRFEPAPLPAKPKKNATDEQKQLYTQQKKALCLSTVGVAVISSVRQSLDQFPDTKARQLIALVDGSYTNQNVLKHLPDRTTLIGRIRRDAKLNESLPAQSRGPRRYGPQASTPEQVLKDESIATQSIRCFIAGSVQEIKVKSIAPLFWRKAGPDRPLRLVVIKPLGYRLTKSSKLLYRQPAFLICTDIHLDLKSLVQAYIYRWEIECNHRDEKSLLGVAQGQVRSPQAVSRLPQLQVAGYSLLLLAALLTYGFDRGDHFLPLPKWRRKKPFRPSALDLQNLLRSFLFERCSHSPTNTDDFTSPQQLNTKYPCLNITERHIAFPTA